MATQELLLTQVRTDGGTQSREKINEEHVSELVEIMKTGKKLPPIDVYHDGTEHWVSDGFHRVMAHTREDKRTIRANVHKGTRQDAIKASIGSNTEHGLKRTNGDKRKAVEMALREFPELSDMAIAEMAVVTREYALRVRHEIAPQPVIRSQVETRIGVDGKARRIPPPPPADWKPPEQPARRPTPPPPGKAPAKASQKDATGHDIPDFLQPLFDRGQEVQEILSDLSRIKGMLIRAQDGDDQLFREVNYQSVFAAIQTAYNEIKATRPYAVCPYCHGLTRESCRACGKRGVMGEYRYNTVPKELR